MRFVYCFVLPTLMFSLLCSTDVHAQFWKRHKKKAHAGTISTDKNKQQKQELPKPHPLKKKYDFNYPASVIKKRYRIDVLIPLYLDDVNPDRPKMPEKAISGMDFYQGVKIAIDTLNTFHYKLDVYVHDITAAGSSLDVLIRNHSLDTADLIIGAVQAPQVPVLATFAKKKQINFISALSPSDGEVKDDPFFILLQPSLQAHCQWMVNTVAKKYYNKHTFLFYRTNTTVDKTAFGFLCPDTADKTIPRLLCNTQPSKQQLARLLDSTRINIIMMGIMDIAYADVLLKQLYTQFPDYNFEVYGMPSWKNMASLKKPEAYPNIGVNFTEPFSFDATTPMAQQIAAAYKKQWGGKPSELVYRGFETTYWYAYMLNQYGTIFNKKLSDNSAAPFTKFDVQPKWDKDYNLLYNENMHLYHFRYQGSSYIIDVN